MSNSSSKAAALPASVKIMMSSPTGQTWMFTTAQEARMFARGRRLGNDWRMWFSLPVELASYKVLDVMSAREERDEQSRLQAEAVAAQQALRTEG